MWTLKMDAPRISLQERRRTCDTQDSWSFELQRTFLGTLLRRATPETHTWIHKYRKNFDGPRSPLL
jgi:hypothetical protein